MTTNRKTLILRFVPRIDTALIVQPRLKLRCIVGQDGKCRNAVFAVVFKLVVTPDNTEIRVKLIESAAGHAKAVDHCLAMLVRVRLTVVRSPLPSHQDMYIRSGVARAPALDRQLAGADVHILMRRLRFPWIDNPG